MFSRYQTFLGRQFLSDLNLLPASVNTLVLQRNSGRLVSDHFLFLKCIRFNFLIFLTINLYNLQTSYLVTIEKGNYIHLAWQFPQIFVMTAAEIMFSITALEFAFTQVKYNFYNFCVCFLRHNN